jgi:cytochrome c2
VQKGAPRSAVLLAVVAIGIVACEPLSQSDVAGNPQRGRVLIEQYGCVTCHTVPGAGAARGNVGPPLGGIRDQVYLGGVVTNSPQNMARWIRAPQAFAPRSAMPDLGVSEGDAQDIVAYLYRLR